MAEEEETPTAETEAPPEAEPVEAAEAPEEAIDWEDLLNKAPDEVMAKHRRVQGIAGSHAERLFLKRQQEWTAEREAESATKAREDLRKLAQDKPLEFADMFLSHDDAEQAKARIVDVERNAAKKLMEQIGAAYHGLPEWAELSDDEKGKLRAAVEESGEDEVLPRFNKVALDIVADRRAERRLQDRLPKEKEAWKKEWEAERLAAEAGPDLRKSTNGSSRRVNWAAMDDKDFDKWWKQRYG